MAIDIITSGSIEVPSERSKEISVIMTELQGAGTSTATSRRMEATPLSLVYGREQVLGLCNGKALDQRRLSMSMKFSRRLKFKYVMLERSLGPHATMQSIIRYRGYTVKGWLVVPGM